MLAIVFPGQGSQKPGMGQEFFEASAGARCVFELVTKATSIDLPRLCFESDEETLRQTQNAQLALFTCGVAAWKAFQETMPHLRPQAMAGHSVGEHAALVAAGILGIEDGARLVQKRGDLMARSGKLRPGTMTAVLGLEKGGLEAVCKEASSGSEVAVIANDNCPGQLVISGDTAAVGRAGELASQRGAKRVLPLNVSGAFHSPLMEEPAAAMGEALRQVSFHHTSISVYSNVTATPIEEALLWREMLEAQLKSPVRWTESVQNMVRDGIHTFVECGVGEVLGGLIRRIDKEVTTLSVQHPESLKKASETLQGALV